MFGAVFIFFYVLCVSFLGRLFAVIPVNSEAHRRIGARGSKCVLHLCKSGLTLAFQVSSTGSSV